MLMGTLNVYQVYLDRIKCKRYRYQPTVIYSQYIYRLLSLPTSSAQVQTTTRNESLNVRPKTGEQRWTTSRMLKDTYHLTP